MTAAYVWTVILGLGLVTYLIRFSFLGLLGNRPLSPGVLRALRYVPSAVIPALVAPMVALDRASGGFAAPHNWLAGLVALGIGAVTRNLVATILGGMGAFHLLRAAGL